MSEFFSLDMSSLPSCSPTLNTSWLTPAVLTCHIHLPDLQLWRGPDWLLQSGHAVFIFLVYIFDEVLPDYCSPDKLSWYSCCTTLIRSWLTPAVRIWVQRQPEKNPKMNLPHQGNHLEVVWGVGAQHHLHLLNSKSKHSWRLPTVLPSTCPIPYSAKIVYRSSKFSRTQ